MATLKVNQSSGPYYTIQSAVNDASPFDVIIVNNGTYNEEVIIGEGRDNIIIRANGDAVILAGTDLPESTGFLVEASYVTINGFTINSFQIGIDITGNYNNIFRNIITNTNQLALRILGSLNNNIYLNEISTGLNYVIYISSGYLNNIARNIITVPTGLIGICCENTSDNSITRNEIYLVDESTSLPFMMIGSSSDNMNRNIIC